jgi:hypothetical protein
MILQFHDASPLERAQGMWRFLQRRGYRALSLLTERTEAFWLGRSYFPLLLAILILALALDRQVAGAAVLLAAATWFAALCPDFLATVTPVMMAILLVCPEYRHLSVFFPCLPLLFSLLMAVAVHFAVWPVTLRLGRSARGLALVSAATLLSGCGAMSADDRGAPLTLYYTVSLGLGMLVLYAIFRSQMFRRHSYDVQERFARIWLTVGLGMAAVVASICLRHLADFAALNGAVPEFKCRNFCATVLLTTMPSAFYLSRRSRWYLTAVGVMAAAMVFSGSRSALLFGAVVLAAGCVYLVHFGVVSRRVMLAVLAVGCGVFLLFGLDGLKLLYNSRMESGHLIGSETNRWRMLAQSVKDFLRYPAFGMGLGNTTNRTIYAGVPGSMFFYHNMIAQIIGSMGLLGVAAYACLIRGRVNLLWQGRRDPFVAMLAISYLGMLLVSMTNPGEFCPFPNAAMMVMLFAMAEDAVGDVAVPVVRLRSRRGVRRLAYMLNVW